MRQFLSSYVFYIVRERICESEVKNEKRKKDKKAAFGVLGFSVDNRTGIYGEGGMSGFFDRDSD